MKRLSVLYLSLLLSGAVLTMASGKSVQEDKDGFKTFFEKFRAAVIKGDKESIAGLSRFPIRMPGRVPNIKDVADLRVRYREVFNKGFDAARCFGERYNDPRFPNDHSYFQAQPDSDNPKMAHFECFDNTSHQFTYSFENTKKGWRFVRLAKRAYDEARLLDREPICGRRQIDLAAY